MTAEVVGFHTEPLNVKPKVPKLLLARRFGCTKRHLLDDIRFLSEHVPSTIWDYQKGQTDLTETQAKILARFRAYTRQTRSRAEALYHLSEDMKNGIW